MNVAFFSSKPYDRQFFDAANADASHAISYHETRLTTATATLASGAPAVCAFVNDELNADVLTALHTGGTRLIALRCAGYNNVDLEAARRLGLTVVHVPEYSPQAIAEHTVALMLTLNRKIHRAFNRVRDGNFSIDGLLGFDFHGKTVGLVGIGKIGCCVVNILHGFGCKVLVVDPAPLPEVLHGRVTVCPLDEMLAVADVITLHCPLIPTTRHLINPSTITRMKRGVMLINTSRGALIDTAAAIDGLLSGQIGYLGLDVYEHEAGNVLVTGHQGFFTHEALTTIAGTTLQAVTDFSAGRAPGFTLVSTTAPVVS